MASFVTDFKHLEIPLEAIKSATNNFDVTHVIGLGRFSKVYKGELLLSEGLTMVALRRLDRESGQGHREFFKDIEVFSCYRHENLISLLGFCNEGGEMILVYEHMSYGSLDKYLSSSDLSWNQRLRICIGAARGLSYLHDPTGTQQRVLHCDIKSANVLLDQHWNAKVADFGLSKMGPANQQYSSLMTSAAGTPVYFDPLYMETYVSTKESDVYSFGVVLFEVLCGRLCVETSKGQLKVFVPYWKKCYEENKIEEIISNSTREQISPDCLERFSGIAYQCLNEHRENRPSMAEVVRELEVALQYQMKHEEESDTEEDDFWETKLPQGWRAMINMFNIPNAIYTIKRELFSYLDKGVLFDEGNKFLWINNDGKISVLISAKRFLELDEGCDHRWVAHNSYARFSVVADYHNGKWHEIRFQIKTSILSLGTMYAASLIFKYSKKPNTELKHLKLMSIKWKTEELSVFSTHNAELTHDNWYKIRMWNFFNHEPNSDFDIVLEKLSYYDDPIESGLLIQGIEFKALETIQHEEIKGIASIPIPHKEDADEEDFYWKKKLPNNYQELIQILDEPLPSSNEKELYLLFCRGFLACHGKLWFSLRESTSGICTMLPATHVLSKDTSFERLETLPLSESRFKKVKVLGNDDWYLFTCRLRAYMFSTHYNYACYLVFKFEENHVQSNDTRFLKSEYRLGDTVQGTVLAHLNLTPPVNIPIIEAKNELGSHDSSNIQRFGGFGKAGHIQDVVNSWMEERNDGWMEVRLSKPLHHLENHVSLEIKLWKSEGGSLSGIIVEGIEFRPMLF